MPDSIQEEEEEEEEEETSQLEIPLTQDTEPSNTSLDQTLTTLTLFLNLFGFYQNTPLTFILSWLAFLTIGVTCPVMIIELTRCSGGGNCDKYQISLFELQSLLPLVALSAISLACLSRNLRKYGLRKLLFVDRYRGTSLRFRDIYVKKINEFFRSVCLWTLLCSSLKLAREIARATYMHYDHLWQSIGIILALFISWTYLTVIFLSGAAIFNLVCSLQVIHFESYANLLDRNLDVSVYIEEHTLLRHYLSKISHRFRMFLLLEFLVVNASLFVALLQTTGNPGILNLINGGDFGVSSIIEIVGIILCLHAAAKITHRAQGIASVASRWHAYVTCNSNGVSHEGSAANGLSNSTSVLPLSSSENDLESTDFVTLPTNIPRSYTSSYNKRQAFVTYLQTNPGGITVYGWAIDRILIDTLFFVEFSLFSFVLGKTVTLTNR